METASPSDGMVPFTGLQGTNILTVEDDDIDDFESIYDVPFVTVNRIGVEFEAEIIFSGIETIDRDRVDTALKVGAEHGVRAYARIFGTYGNVKLLFSDDPSKGDIYGPSEEMAL